MKLGEFLRNYREEHNISQRSFAKACGVSNGYISMIENGINPKTGGPITPTVQKLQSIASGMGITVHELLSQVDDIMLDISAPIKPAFKESGLDELVSIFRSLTPDNRSKLLELARLYLSAQDRT